VTHLARLAIRVRGDRAELALADLLPLLPGGAEQRAAGDDVEYVLYGPPAELPGRAEIDALAGDAVLAVAQEPVADGWERRFHAYLRPVTVSEAGRSLTVRPPWLDGDAADLVIDPDVHFGAGTHATTRLCLRLLLDEPAPGGPLCDWGAGTGVLAIAASRLGYDPVVAVEHAPGAPEVIAANAAANGVAVAVRALDLTTEAPWAPTVCVNVPGPLLRALPARLERAPERLLVAGMPAAEAAEIAGAFAPLGLREDRRIDEDGWGALRLVAA
jgi:ribosomal protein L11 methyltransferase